MARKLGVTDLAEKNLRAREMAIAERFTGGFPWLIVFWGLGNTLVWLALWPLVLTGTIPLWLGFLIATANVTLSYLPSHDAQHYIIARKGSRYEWFNDLVGHISIFPLTLPFRTARITHMAHHRYANDPERDPDYSTRASNGWDALRKSILNRQPRAKAGFNRYGELLMLWGTPAAKAALLDAMAIKVLHFGILAGLAWSGYAIEAALLWWLPKHIALTYILFYLSWAPHHPADQSGRYRDTRAFKSRVGNIGSMGMQYHIVHHLYPTIPLDKTPAAFRALRPILVERGCELGGLEH
jgi:beta-carotene hydroxylase